MEALNTLEDLTQDPNNANIGTERGAALLETSLAKHGAGLNGISDEALIAIVIDRLIGFNSGPYRSRDNSLAITKLEEALIWMQKRP